ncbi:hypothetical protein TeGR_g3505 [Tetraparma gracilis]|uniref:Uncharacterized protein n=1 Tax=Tetraparma gracilis TaxID=2962635 RepID=A0ABQ6MHI1_9STRA|nr:hypothetical protein TeGR_g3505 [Tetraparma gracilis]
MHNQGLSALNPQNLLKGGAARNRYLVMVFLLTSQMLFIAFDILCTQFKYGEGWKADCTGAIDYVVGGALAAKADDVSSAMDADGVLNWGENTTAVLTMDDIAELRSSITETKYGGSPNFDRFYMNDVQTDDPAIGCVMSIQAAAAFSDKHKDMHGIAGDLLNWSWTFQSSGMFLFLAWTNDVIKNSMSLSKTKTGGGGVMQQWEYIAQQVYSVMSIIMYLIVPTFYEDASLEQVVVPQCIGVVEWGTLAILVFLTRYRIGNLMTTVKDVQVVRILDRLRVLMAYSCITLVLECFGMGMMDFDIVAWHSAFKADGEAHGTNRIVYDPTHPFMTDLMTTIYSTGFAFVPLPVIMMMFPPHMKGSQGKVAVTGASGATTVDSSGGESPSPGGEGGTRYIEQSFHKQ